MADFVQGFKYAFGIHMGVSRGPVDELIEIKVADKTAWRGSITANGNTTIDKGNLFGGEKGEGGIIGTLTAMFGEPDQVAPPELATVLKTPTPGFRRRFTLFFDGIIAMMNPYPKPWKFRVRRALKGWDGDPWYPEKAVISLVRPLSTGEVNHVEGNVEVATVSRTFVTTIEVTEDLGPWEFTFVPEDLTAPAPTVVRLYATAYNDDSGGYQSRDLIEGTDYTRVGDVFTLYSVELVPPMGDADAIVSNYSGRKVHVDYTYEKTTVDPTGADGGIGDTLIKAMNPVHILYETITNREWGRGLDRAAMDDAMWKYAADQAHAEGFGMCIRWNRTDRIDNFIKLVLDHVGGAVYDDRRTGKVSIRLFRDDYVKADLPLYQKGSGLLGMQENDVSTMGGTINEMKVTYHDPVTDEDRTVRAANLAAWQAGSGAVNARTMTYEGVPVSEIASKLAKRDLRALSAAIRRFTITLDRRAYNVTPGAVIRVQDLDRGIADMVLRVATVDYGNIDQGTIQVKALQDVFALPQRGFTQIGPPTWEPPATQAACIGLRHSFEAPYRSIYRYVNAADLSFINPGSAYLATVAQEGKPLNTTYDIAVRSGAPEVEDNPPDDSFVCPT